MLSIATQIDLAQTSRDHEEQRDKFFIEGFESHNKQIEFSSGEAICSNVDMEVNEIRHANAAYFLKRYLRETFDLHLLVKLLFPLLMINSQSFEYEPVQKFIFYYSILLLAIEQLVNLAIHIITFWNLVTKERSVNGRKCTVFKNIKKIKLSENELVYPFESISWGQLRVGQLVCLERGERCPADLLILDSSQEEVFIETLRYPCPSTFIQVNSSQKGLMIDFAINLSGVIVFNQTSGTLKLKNDPKATHFTEQNMIFRGETLTCEWIYGIAILVGSDCVKLNLTNKKKSISNYRLPDLVLLLILLIPKIILDQRNGYYELSDYGILSMMILPYSQGMWQKLLLLVQIINEQYLYHNIVKQNDQKEIRQRSSIKIIQESEDKVLLSPNRNMNATSTQRSDKDVKLREIHIGGLLPYTNCDLSGILQADMLVIESPEAIFKKKHRIMQIIFENNRYIFNYERLKATKKTDTTSPIKILINTCKTNLYDELKPSFDTFMLEKKTPAFGQEQNKKQRISIQYQSTRQVSIADNIQKQSNPFASMRKQSARNLFNSTNKIGAEPQNSPQGTPHSAKNKQRSRIMTMSKFGNERNSPGQSSSDRMAGEIYNESDFLENPHHHEILIMILLCNDLFSYFDQETRKIVDIFDNQLDASLIEFAGLMGYQMAHSSQMENTRPEYIVNQITKRSINVHGNTQVYEILYIFKVKNQNRISVLVRDPESFLLEEGALLYTREQTFEVHDKTLRDMLHEFQWEGIHSFVYSRRQLTYQETTDILKKLSQPGEINKIQEMHEYYHELESQSEIKFAIGLKQVYGHKNQVLNMIYNPTYKENLFITLGNFGLKHVLFSGLDYIKLTVFLRNYHIIQNEEQLLYLNNEDKSQLTYKFRQQIQYMIEEQEIFSYNKLESKYIIISPQAFEIILKDEYLLGHFVFIVYYSSAVAAYQFSSSLKGRLVKILKEQFKIITVGCSMDNSQLYHQSQYSFEINGQDISNQTYSLNKLMDFIKILLIVTPLRVMQSKSFMNWQVYRSIVCGLVFYFVQFYYETQEMFLLLVFFMISNITTIAITIPYKIKNTIELDEIANGHRIYQVVKNCGLNYEPILLAIIDSALLATIYSICLNVHVQMKFAILFCSIEIIEKVHLVKHRIHLAPKIGLISLITIVICQVSISSYYNFDIQEFYTNDNIIIYIFTATISFLMTVISSSLQQEQDLQDYSTNISVRTIANNLKNTQPIQAPPQKLNMIKNKSIMDEQLQKILFGEEGNVDKLDGQLRFTDAQTEKDYQLQQKINLSVILLSTTVFEMISLGFKLYVTNAEIIILIISVIQILQVAIFRSRNAIIFAGILRLLFKVATDFVMMWIIDRNVDLLLILPWALCITITVPGIVNVMVCIIIECIVNIIWQAFSGYTRTELIFIELKSMTLLLSLVYLIYKVTHKLEFLQRHSYIFESKFHSEQKKLNDTLGLLMPRFIKERMTKGQISISEDQGEVSILFCDISEFDSIIKAQQENIVEFLDSVFRSFDQLCQSNDVQKIETVGKTYMAAAGLRDYDIVMNQKHQNSTQRVLETAIGMMEAVRSLRYGDDKEVILRIGIHYGRVIAGVIGAHKPQFSLIGDTVNTTSRVCSTGGYGFITISEQAYQNIDNLTYKFTERQVEAKGKGLMTTYQLVNQRKTSRQPTQYHRPQHVPLQQQFSVSPSKKIRRSACISGIKLCSPKIGKRVLKIKARESIELNQEQSNLKAPSQYNFSRQKSQSLSDFQKSEKLMKDTLKQLDEKPQKNLRRPRGSVLGAAAVFRRTIIKKNTDQDQEPMQSVSRLAVYQIPKQIILEEDVEIPKNKKILKQQSLINQEFLTQILKYKVDSYQPIDVLNYKDADHCCYYSIYEQFSLAEYAYLKKFFIFNILQCILLNCLYFIISDDLDSVKVPYIILCVIQTLAVILININALKFDQSHRVELQNSLVFDFIIHLVISIAQISQIHDLDFEIVFQVFSCTIRYIRVTQLQIFEFKNIKRLSYVYGIYAVVIMIVASNIEIIFIVIGVLGLNYTSSKSIIQLIVKNYQNSLDLNSQIEKQETILQHLLPIHILGKFMSDNTAENFTDIFENATILYADIAGFTKYSSSVQPEQVVTMLRSLFISFDRCCQELNVYKLYTIGDCYVSMGIIDARDRDPVDEAINIAIFGLKMIEIINNIRKVPEFQHLNMRIGVHTGKIIGGVVGTDVVRYDIYGEDVTIANKMESNGTEGRMMISEVTKELLETNTEDMFLYEHATDVYIPSSGLTMKGYFVTMNQSNIEN